MSLLPKNNVNLPPLLVNGEPKILNKKMTVKDMHICLINAMRQCYKSCPFFIFTQTNEKLPWWPSELPWSLNFQNAMPNKHERRLLYRHLLTTCYMYYGQLETLHLFDTKPGDTPKWIITEVDKNENKLICTTSNRVLAIIPSHEILPLIALQSKQKELSQMVKDKTLSVEPAEEFPTHSANYFSSNDEEYDEKLNCNSTNVSVTLTPLEICTDQEVVQHRRLSVSIMGPLLSRRSSDADAASLSDVEQSPCDWLTCPVCSFAQFSCKENLLHHMILCKPESQAQVQKDAFMFQLGLVPEQTLGMFDEVVKRSPKRTFSVKKSTNFDVKLLTSKLPVSSLLSRKFLSQMKKPNGKYSFFDSRNYKKTSSYDRLSTNKPKIFPVVYKPPRIPVHYHMYSYTNAERKLRAEFLETGGLNKESRLLLKSCKCCTVNLERLSESMLKKYGVLNIVQNFERSAMRRRIIPPKIYDNSVFPKRRNNRHLKTVGRPPLQKTVHGMFHRRTVGRPSHVKAVGRPSINNLNKNKPELKVNKQIITKGDHNRKIIIRRINQPWWKENKVKVQTVKTRRRKQYLPEPPKVDPSKKLIDTVVPVENNSFGLRFTDTLNSVVKEASTKVASSSPKKFENNNKTPGKQMKVMELLCKEVKVESVTNKVVNSNSSPSKGTSYDYAHVKLFRPPAILRGHYRTDLLNNVRSEPNVKPGDSRTKNGPIFSTEKVDDKKILLRDGGKDRTVCVRLDKSIYVPPGVKINNVEIKKKLDKTTTEHDLRFNRSEKSFSNSSSAVSGDKPSHSSAAADADVKNSQNPMIKYDSILFKCHLCDDEILFHSGTWRNVESHMNSLHKGIPCFYTQNEHFSPGSTKYIVLMVEAFQIKR